MQVNASVRMVAVVPEIEIIMPQAQRGLAALLPASKNKPRPMKGDLILLQSNRKASNRPTRVGAVGVVGASFPWALRKSYVSSSFLSHCGCVSMVPKNNYARWRQGPNMYRWRPV